MKETIKAKVGYRVRRDRDEAGHRWVFDGDQPLMSARIRSREDFIDEVLQQNNDSAALLEVFVTVKGNKFAYWTDLETGEDFLTKIAEADKEVTSK